jgi:hypothetical protein
MNQEAIGGRLPQMLDTVDFNCSILKEVFASELMFTHFDLC